MHKEAHKSIDVDVFKEILENEFFSQEQAETTRDDLIEMVRRINKVEIKVQGIDLDRKKESAKIKHRQFGFRAKTDFKLDFKQDVFENETTICLIPQKIYELEDEVKKMPVPYCDKGKLLQLVLGDAFERLKTKAKNILQNSGSDEQIIHYAKKNIQMALRNCYDARMFLIKIQKTKNRNAIFLVFMVNVFMINVVMYLQNMFSSYYKDSKSNKIKEKAELYDVMDWNVIMEPQAEYGKKKETEEIKPEIILPVFKWNDQVNILLTMIYDLLHKDVEGGLKALDASSQAVQDVLHLYFIDKKGIPFNKLTVKTALSESREDKRAKGNKRIDIDRYFDE